VAETAVVPVYVVGADLVSFCELEREWVALALALDLEWADVEEMWDFRFVVVNGLLFGG
jgi:hypothetical protein